MGTMHPQSNQQPSDAVTLQEFLDELGRDDVARMNLAGYFDVLIEMDLELKECTGPIILDSIVQAI
jgi:hypothetical protein